MWLYIIIPIVLVFIYHYQKLWAGVSEWVYLINEHIMLLPLVLFVNMGRIRTCIYEADQLSIFQKKRWFSELRFWCHVQSYIYETMRVIILFLLVNVFLLKYLISWLTNRMILKK